MYVLILTYVLNNEVLSVPREEYSKLSFCVEALKQSAQAIHRQGGRVVSASCDLKPREEKNNV